MDEDILKHLANKELKQIILNDAKKILCERNKKPKRDNTETPTNISQKKRKIKETEIYEGNKKYANDWENNKNEFENENENENQKEQNNENITARKGDETKNKEELSLKEQSYLLNKEKTNFSGKTDKMNITFFNLQNFSTKYSETCKIYDMGYGNIEYDLLLSFIKIFNSEMNYQLNYNQMSAPNIHDKDIVHKLVKAFLDKLLFYCTTPAVIFSPHNTDVNGLFDTEVAKHIKYLFNKLAGYNNFEILLKSCIEDILLTIFNFQPNPEHPVSWITRQAFVDLIKIIIEDNSNRAQQCILSAIDLIKQKHINLSFFQLDNLVVITEIIQYGVFVITEKKKEMKNFLYKNEEWYENLCELLNLLKNSEWILLFKQLLVTHSFLNLKKKKHFNKNFNEWYNSRIETASFRNCSYSRWFKIEMPISMSIFKQSK